MPWIGDCPPARAGIVDSYCRSRLLTKHVGFNSDLSFIIAEKPDFFAVSVN